MWKMFRNCVVVKLSIFVIKITIFRELFSTRLWQYQKCQISKGKHCFEMKAFHFKFKKIAAIVNNNIKIFMKERRYFVCVKKGKKSKGFTETVICIIAINRIDLSTENILHNFSQSFSWNESKIPSAPTNIYCNDAATTKQTLTWIEYIHLAIVFDLNKIVSIHFICTYCYAWNCKSEKCVLTF